MKAVKAGMLIDGTGDAPIESPIVILDGCTIHAVVGETELQQFGPDVEVIDCTDHWILPGFIDLHVHLRNPHEEEVPRQDQFRHRIAVSSPLAVLYGVRAAQRCLSAGFTTLRNMGGVEFTALDQAFERGVLLGPRVFTSGMVLKTGGHTDKALPATLPREGTWKAWKTADGPDEIRKAVREFVRAGAAFIKLEASGGLYESFRPGYSAEELATATDEAHGLGRRVAVHAHSQEGILAAIRAGCDTIEHGTFMDEECVDAMAQSGTAFVPTMSIMRDSISRGLEWGYSDEQLREEERLLRVRMDAVGKAHEAGVPIGLGTDSAGWIARHGDNAWEFQLLNEAGLSPLECISSGTGIAATALGMAESLGTVTAGKRADLVVVRNNPLQDISLLRQPTNIKMIWKDGAIVVDRRSDDTVSAVTASRK